MTLVCRIVFSLFNPFQLPAPTENVVYCEHPKCMKSYTATNDEVENLKKQHLIDKDYAVHKDFDLLDCYQYHEHNLVRNASVTYTDGNRDMDKIVRVGFYKTHQEFFTLHDNSLKVANHIIPKDELPQNVSLARYGSATRKREFYDVRASVKTIEDIIKSFPIGAFCFADFIVNPSGYQLNPISEVRQFRN